MKKRDRVLIEVTETRAISADGHCWQLVKRTKLKDKDSGEAAGGYSEWIPYKYYNEIEQAAAALERDLQRECGASTFPELRRAANHIHELMLETVREAKII